MIYSHHMVLEISLVSNRGKVSFFVFVEDLLGVREMPPSPNINVC